MRPAFSGSRLSGARSVAAAAAEGNTPAVTQVRVEPLVWTEDKETVKEVFAFAGPAPERGELVELIGSVAEVGGWMVGAREYERGASMRAQSSKSGRNVKNEYRNHGHTGFPLLCDGWPCMYTPACMRWSGSQKCGFAGIHVLGTW